jgi:glycosyltransferase involved in cell wall biosynthesis
MTITVIVPAYNADATLGRCLSALAASRRAPDEVIVVDDRSTDGTADRARELGARVIVLPEGRGPAAARNHGARQARGELLVFVDADVAVHADALERIEDELARNPGVAALFGSYDDDPPETGLASRYKNLLHHHTHQSSRRDAATFWAGCGAIRSSVFLAAGGFDERYRHPAIEDIELGARLIASGWRVWSTPDVQATHLKRWTFWNLIATGIFRRAIPWSRLIAQTGVLPDDLNRAVPDASARFAPGRCCSPSSWASGSQRRCPARCRPRACWAFATVRCSACSRAAAVWFSPPPPRGFTGSTAA